jgi:hypothetical protein
MVLDALRTSSCPQVRLQTLIDVNRRDGTTGRCEGDCRAGTHYRCALQPARTLACARASLVLVIGLPAEEAARPEAPEIAASFGNYFASRAAAIAGEQRELFRLGRLSLVIGTTVLVSCLLASQLLAPRIHNPTIARPWERA